MDLIQISDQLKKKMVELDIGRSDDFEGAFRISGVDWLSDIINTDNEGTARPFIDGRAIHQKAVEGGTKINSYLIVELPKKDFNDYTDVSNYLLTIRYQDLQKKDIRLNIQNINQGNFLEFTEIPGAKIHLTGDGKWKTATFIIPPQNLGWYMGTDYQKYHIDLLNNIYAHTKDIFFKDTSERWQDYLEAFENENKKNGE
ncbi:hypothetical protein AB4Z22_11860 [Paenibacillus sp. TAF58]